MESIKKRNTISKSKLIFMVLLAVAVLIQLARPEKNISPSPAGKAFVDTFKVSEQVNAILAVSCYDCHSNNTNYPWYSEIQPMAWLMENHIIEGKDKLNFDDLPPNGSRRLNSKFTQITKQIEQDKMPLTSYLWMHEGASLSLADKKLLVDYFNSLTDNE
ncbi:heme-binding domain-containing protein [Myroides odoratimimus]|uniref:heme-binding domain-containing protein n=1 Tax=Myroides odoratimimus TaxID=76832 RepID=UPI0025763CCA|nr:heme-binding domain-containing protein [Myroides odoratimimus]MDM1086791.1 heme-binding domain-containing protein [Myroides odoratimimus]